MQPHTVGYDNAVITKMLHVHLQEDRVAWISQICCFCTAVVFNLIGYRVGYVNHLILQICSTTFYFQNQWTSKYYRQSFHTSYRGWKKAVCTCIKAHRPKVSHSCTKLKGGKPWRGGGGREQEGRKKKRNKSKEHNVRAIAM